MTGESTHSVPQANDMEEAILGALLMDGGPFVLEAIADAGLTADDFYRESHRKIFEAALPLAERGECDDRTVAEALKRSGELKAVGGKVALVTLTQRVPAIASSKRYAAAIVEAAKRRWLVDACHEGARAGYEQLDVDADELVNRIAAQLAEYRPAGAEADWQTFAEAMPGLYDTLWERHESGAQIAGLTTGFRRLDDRTGGLARGMSYLVAGRPAMGKSALAMNIVEAIALLPNEHALVFSQEMTREQLFARIISGWSKVAANRLVSGVPAAEDFELIADAMKRLRESGLADRLHVNAASGMTPMQIRTKTRRLKRRLERKGERVGVVMVDYLQIMRPDRPTPDNPQQEMSSISQGLTLMAKELDVPVLAVSQLNRGVEHRKPPRPILSDLRDSGTLEQDATAVILLYRPGYYGLETPDTEGKAEAIVAKSRHGETGSVWLDWEGKYTRFTDASPVVHAPIGTPVDEEAVV